MRPVRRFTIESRVGYWLRKTGRTLIMTRRAGPVQYGIALDDHIERWGDLDVIARELGCMREDEQIVKPSPTIIEVLPKGEAGS